MSKQHIPAAFPTDKELLNALQIAGERFCDKSEETGWVCNIHSSGEVELLLDACTNHTVRKALAVGLGLIR